ncbi:MAG: hypothetical protein HIU84_07100 [Acidobacteria bacterium]|nr:hypothetical protein [Acidobacteriota bacterium]
MRPTIARNTSRRTITYMAKFPQSRTTTQPQTTVGIEELLALPKVERNQLLRASHAVLGH